LMRVLGTDRRQTVYENRVTMLEACKGAVTVTYEYRTNGSWRSLVYHVDLEKLKELAPGHVAKSDTYGPQRKAIHMAADSTTESDTLPFTSQRLFQLFRFLLGTNVSLSRLQARARLPLGV